MKNVDSLNIDYDKLKDFIDDLEKTSNDLSVSSESLFKSPLIKSLTMYNGNASNFINELDKSVDEIVNFSRVNVNACESILESNSIYEKE